MTQQNSEHPHFFKKKTRTVSNYVCSCGNHHFFIHQPIFGIIKLVGGNGWPMHPLKTDTVIDPFCSTINS